MRPLHYYPHHHPVPLFPISTLHSFHTSNSQSQTHFNSKLKLSPLQSTIMYSNQNTLSFSHATSNTELDMMAAHEAFKASLNTDVCHSGSSSGCSGHDSPTCFFMPKSVSSLSLQNNDAVYSHFAAFLESEDGPVRRVYSAGDLQRFNSIQHNCGRSKSGSPLQIESNMIINGMNKACRYSPEEKKERIERYRSKRAKRNFNKKIKYECRKTLADSRPRIRGRFARNNEIDKSPQVQWNHILGEEDEDINDDNWISFLNNFTANIIQ